MLIYIITLIIIFILILNINLTVVSEIVLDSFSFLLLYGVLEPEFALSCMILNNLKKKKELIIIIKTIWITIKFDRNIYIPLIYLIH